MQTKTSRTFAAKKTVRIRKIVERILNETLKTHTMPVSGSQNFIYEVSPNGHIEIKPVESLSN